MITKTLDHELLVNKTKNMGELIYEPKRQLLEYVSNNYETVVKSTKNGAYIEIDLIPDGHDGLHDIIDLFLSCDNLGIKVEIIVDNTYPRNIGDGIRMGRYMYFMEKTTELILTDLKNYKKT